MEFADPRKPKFRLGVLCEAGADAKQLSDLLAPIVAEAKDPDVPVQVTTENGLVLLSIGRAESVDGAGGALY